MSKPIPIIDIQKSSVNAQREEVNTKDLFAAIASKKPAEITERPYNGSMKFHIEIQKKTKAGDSLRIVADADNEYDLNLIHEKYKDHIPKGKWWERIL